MPRIPRPNAPNRAKFSPVRSTPRAVKPADSASRTRPDHNNKTPERSTRRAGEVPNRPKGRMSRGESTVKRSSATPFAGARNDRPERSPRGSPRADGSFRSERPYRSERAERGSPSTASRQGTPRSAPSPRFSGFRVARDEGSRKSYARSDSRMPSSRDRSINPRLSGGSFRSENAPPERSWGRCEDVKALGRERPNRPDRSTHAKVGFRNHEARSPRTDQKSDRPSDRPSHDRYKPLNRPTVGEKSSHVARTPYPDKPRRPPRPFSPSSSRSTNNLSGTPFRAPQPRVVAPTPRIDDADGGERIHKALAQLGWGARREIEEWIRQGDVWVNGKSCELGTVLQAGDKIEIIRGQKQWREDTPAVGRRGRGGNTREVERFITWFPQSADHLPRVLLYHKPEGEIVSRNDPQFRPSVFVNLPKVRGGRWVNIGRLDVGSSGLILFTDDGELANQLMHPSSNLEREYAVRIDGTLSEEHMRQLMTGIEVEEAGMVQCVSVKPMSDKNEGRNQWYKFVLTEGKNREIRRMVESLGYQVSRLMRLRYGPVFMPRGLRRGKYEELEQSSVEKLLRLLGSKDAPKKSSRSVRSAPNKEALRHT
jgi:23S rRNA pseudouridine2605 synthase